MTADERRLLRLFRALNDSQRQGLLDYAEFLSRREADPRQTPPQKPLDIPRPEKESVVKAIKRLRQTYPMVDRARILHDTSHLLTQHLVHGKPAEEVIDDLEDLFRRHYRDHYQTTGSAR
ncbi:MAG TPA: hypothetical protein PKH69_12395 [Thiobacillaceae bacterium]|nr:hypothetical protein [Thiobacillaceae bacterium]HNU65309.1 hypothetical protein [Thiobacillaceae bacterium]